MRKKFIDVQDAGCGCCTTTAITSLHSTWAERKAIQNYEIFMNSEYDANLNWATNIDTVAATRLGIEGWALFDVGSLEEPGTFSTSLSTAVGEGRGAARLSICLPSSSTNMFDWYPSSLRRSSQATGVCFTVSSRGNSLSARNRRRATTARSEFTRIARRSSRRISSRQIEGRDDLLQARRR